MNNAIMPFDNLLSFSPSIAALLQSSLAPISPFGFNRCFFPGTAGNQFVNPANFCNQFVNPNAVSPFANPFVNPNAFNNAFRNCGTFINFGTFINLGTFVNSAGFPGCRW